jgi:hypothetical protein
LFCFLFGPVIFIFKPARMNFKTENFKETPCLWQAASDYAVNQAIPESQTPFHGTWISF